MIDLHAHVLPGIDDGPPNAEESLALLRVAALEGTRVIAATPHLRRDFPRVSVEDIADSCGRLQEQVPEEWDLRVVCGGEVDLGWAMRATDEHLRMASYGGHGTDLLIETPYGTSPRIFEPPLRRLMDKGYRVLLAHPELNPGLQESCERLEALVHLGVLVQITGASLLPDPRRSRRSRLARRLVKDGLAHVIASDAHSSGPRRPPGCVAAVEVARGIAPERADWMVTAVPAAILAGEPLPPMPYQADR
ncbi:MAG: CpsB/CapC family capsule biosynthesis tyrosine phosphatase [Solirubrobacteraceae bacterium]